MRSKSVVARPRGEDKPAACATDPRPLRAPATLALVGSADPRPAGALKPGLY